MSRLLCWLGLHSWDYSGNAYSHAPRPIHCERCGVKYGARRRK